MTRRREAAVPAEEPESKLVREILRQVLRDPTAQATLARSLRECLATPKLAL